eukprot:TRINITY_DN66757_c0_g1_i1.p1 TRINITY_DN66757_c0_g1~~TRINITY_DN66757_c0_g1_i1.p1  ORF type:complete len:278 (-),score=28.07 TRINITY_DN66757_c0_g1_i1:608-1441(-)
MTRTENDCGRGQAMAVAVDVVNAASGELIGTWTERTVGSLLSCILASGGFAEGYVVKLLSNDEVLEETVSLASLQVSADAPLTLACAIVKLKKVLVLGLDNAGKSTLLRYIAKEQGGTCNFETKTWFCVRGIERTFQFKTCRAIDMELICFDVGMSLNTTAVTDSLIQHAAGLVWVFDSVDRRRYSESVDELRRMLLRVPGVPVLCILTKQDLMHTMAELRDRHQLTLLSDLHVLQGRQWKIVGYPSSGNPALQLFGDSYKETLAEGLVWLNELVLS